MSAPLILASGSPRRRAFMQAIGVPVQVRPVDIDETPLPHESPLVFAERMAAEKAMAGSNDTTWALGSDTVVTVDDRILGKPADPAEARAMLADLAGRTHHVITAWALARGTELLHGYSRTGVRFRALTPAEIAAYVATGDPLDKAGAYGIQSGAGRFVEGIDGSYDGVVGLPVVAVCTQLAEAGIVDFPFGMAPRVAAVREAIAAASIGRESPALVAVSKGHPVERIREAMRLGLGPFGESYVQAWQAKIEAFAATPALPSPEWHFIGRVQSNKARFIGAHASLVHGVDTLKSGRALARGAADVGRTLRVCVQLNPDDPAKGGVPADAVPDLVDALNAVDHLEVAGLMLIPPLGVDPVPHFERLRDLADALALPVRSMGMSGDYPAAIRCGATHVRIGTALFGPRS